MRNLVGSWKVYLGKTAIILLTFTLFASVASCKHKPTESKKPILTSLTIDGKAVEIKDEMNGGTTTNRRVKVAYTYEPSDATVECNPILNPESKWEFQDFGENILKITVKKGTEEKLYTFKITKESSEVIQSLQIGQDIKRSVDKDNVVAGIENEMEFAVPFNANSVAIDLKLKEGAVATWKAVTPGAPEVKENKITFGTGNDLELSRPVYKLTVTDKNGEVNEYTVKVIKMVAYIFMNKEANVSSDTKYTFNKDLNKIINHDETFELQIEEPKLDLKWYSPTIKWKSFVVHVDGKDLPSVVTDPAVKDFAVGKMIIPFNKGETKEIIVKIENNEVQVEEEEGVKTVTPLTGNLARETFKFKVTRLDKRIDLPTSYLKLSGKDIVKNNPEMLAKLHSDTNFPDCIASDPCTVKIGLNKKLTKITINDQDITSQTINPNGTKKEYSSPELEITGFKNAPKVVTIVATPEDTETYRETTWKLK